LISGGVGRVCRQAAELALPIGWPERNSLSGRMPKAPTDSLPTPSWPNGWSSLARWSITAIAVSLGTHFWFDPLAKFVDIRAAGSKPDKAADQ
jgi:hypothetical protein